MFELKPKRDNEENLDFLNKVFQPLNELFDQGTAVLDNRFASFKADVKKLDDKYVVEAELPGFKKDEISLDYNQNYLTIKAETDRKDEVKEEGRVIRRERHTGQCIRRFYVEGVEEEQIKAKLDDGVLYIELPLTESERVNRIEIE